jgi:microcystin degradation protein MlrC
MAIAVASVMQESNDFSPVKTRYEDFGFAWGQDARDRHQGAQTELGGFLKVLSAGRHKVETLCAGWAVTAGRMRRADYLRLSNEFGSSLSRLSRIDGLLIALHGGQTSEPAPDVAGDLARMARTILGPRIPIVVTLDLHANVTKLLVESVNALVGYKTYPHVDLYETGIRGAELLLKILAGTCRPVISFRKLPLIIPAENMQTRAGPFARLMEAAVGYEKTGRTEAVSIFGVQPWLDVPEMGGSIVSVTNGEIEEGQVQVDEIGRRFWDSRKEFDVKLTPVRRALKEALSAAAGPIVISEPSDSTGSGSPGDSTGVLGPLLKMSISQPAALFIVDPEVVRKAITAGVGATIKTSVGGKFDRKNSRPVRIVARVRLISDGRWTTYAPGYNSGVETCMGRSAVLDIGRVRLLVAERSAMTVDPALYRSHGIEPEQMKIVVVKSPNGFRAQYESIAKEIYLVDTPGVSTPKLRTIAYKHVPRPIYPLDPHLRLKIPALS